MDYGQITKEFTQRTKLIVENYKGEYEVTLLVNCCLGLLVFPKEHRYDAFPDKVIPESGELWGLSRKSVEGSCGKQGYKLRDVLRKIRKGICHFNIESEHDEKGKIEYVVIKDRGKFSARLSVSQLKELVTKIAEHVQCK